MKLVNFSVTNFRSITNAHKVAISETTILVGKNNEGKSNILKALTVAMNLLERHAKFHNKTTPRSYTTRSSLATVTSTSSTYARRYRKDERFYFWERDFPVNLQSHKRKAKSIFRLEFL